MPGNRFAAAPSYATAPENEAGNGSEGGAPDQASGSATGDAGGETGLQRTISARPAGVNGRPGPHRGMRRRGPAFPSRAHQI